MMKAAFFQDIGRLEVNETPAPQINEDELLVEVKAAAICGTDLRIYKFGHFKIPEGTGRVLCHEFSGVIKAVGKNTVGYQVGDRVGVAPNVGCGTCEMCKRGYNQLCADYEAFGISYDGGFQQLVRIPAGAVAGGNVVKLPDSLSFVAAALVEPFSCTYHSYQALRTVPGDTVVIIGAGPIGACHVMINKLAGGTQIIVADISASRLEEIKKFGVDHTIDTSHQDLAKEVMTLTEGRGADVVITACSVPAVQQQALEIAAVHGRINFFGGMPKGKEVLPLNSNLIHYKELTALGTTGSSLQDYVDSMKIATTSGLNLEALATGVFDLDHIQDAFDAALAGVGMKTVITF